MVALQFIGMYDRRQSKRVVSPELAVQHYVGSINVSGGPGGVLTPGGPPAPPPSLLSSPAVEPRVPVPVPAMARAALELAPPPPPPPVPVNRRQKAAKPGDVGARYAPMCQPGYSGCICKPCEPGMYVQNSTQCGSCLQCTPNSLKENLNLALPGGEYKCHSDLQKILEFTPRTGLPGARNEDECDYKCRAELIFPDCVDPFMQVESTSNHARIRPTRWST